MKAKATLASLISEPGLKKLAGERYFARGLAYFRGGAIARLRADEDGIWARVVGTEPYAVRLWLERRTLRWGCTCPLGIDGEFCKHLVATGLAWLSRTHQDYRARLTPELKEIRDFLKAADKEALADMVFERTIWDVSLTEELLLEARARAASSRGTPKRSK